MGSSHSAARTVTLENAGESSVIKITENVVDRLQGASKEESTNTTIKEKEQDNINQIISPHATEAVFVTSHQIRKEVDREIGKNNAYWENRLKTLRDGYRKINQELEEEYNKAVKEVNQSLGKHYSGSNSDLKSCKRNKNSVIECYNSNKDQPLLCSEEVQKFNDCVTNSMNIILKAK